jgi:hypothetical protein
MRADSVKLFDQNRPHAEDKDDLDKIADLEPMPDATDIEEGDEEKDDGEELPPAMPPAV